jgi:hypothetical protein
MFRRTCMCAVLRNLYILAGVHATLCSMHALGRSSEGVIPCSPSRKPEDYLGHDDNIERLISSYVLYATLRYFRSLRQQASSILVQHDPPLQILTSLGMLISRISTPFCKSLLLGILPLLINSALCAMYGSRIMLATATTSSPLV